MPGSKEYQSLRKGRDGVRRKKGSYTAHHNGGPRKRKTWGEELLK